MSDLFEKDPQVAAIVDRQTNGDLLAPPNPSPLVIDTSGGAIVASNWKYKTDPRE